MSGGSTSSMLSITVSLSNSKAFTLIIMESAMTCIMTKPPHTIPYQCPFLCSVLIKIKVLN